MVEIFIFKLKLTLFTTSFPFFQQGRCFKERVIHLCSLLHWLLLLIRSPCICTSLSTWIVPGNCLWVKLGAADLSIQFVSCCSSSEAWLPSSSPAKKPPHYIPLQRLSSLLSSLQLSQWAHREFLDILHTLSSQRGFSFGKHLSLFLSFPPSLSLSLYPYHHPQNNPATFPICLALPFLI